MTIIFLWSTMVVTRGSRRQSTCHLHTRILNIQIIFKYWKLDIEDSDKIEQMMSLFGFGIFEGMPYESSELNVQSPKAPFFNIGNWILKIQTRLKK